ncbi:MAG: hypothetical protein ACK58J_25405, partial [Planctomyces sp.]
MVLSALAGRMEIPGLADLFRRMESATDSVRPCAGLRDAAAAAHGDHALVQAAGLGHALLQRGLADEAQRRAR